MKKPSKVGLIEINVSSVHNFVGCTLSVLLISIGICTELVKSSKASLYWNSYWLCWSPRRKWYTSYQWLLQNWFIQIKFYFIRKGWRNCSCLMESLQFVKEWKEFWCYMSSLCHMEKIIPEKVHPEKSWCVRCYYPEPSDKHV